MNVIYLGYVSNKNQSLTAEFNVKRKLFRNLNLLLFQILDPTLMKKKKKKKIPFDLEEALADDVTDQNAEKEDSRKDDGGNDFDENLDLENFGKKKKKKKKPFNLDELENNLPVETEEPSGEASAVNEGAGEEGGNADEEYDLDVDFSKTKKKKKKKKDLDELVAEKLEEEVQINKENGKFNNRSMLD